MYIFISIIAFSLIIATHELGHFTAAKLLGVRVYEFAIGMGPAILKKQGKETLYTLRALPIGGFCSMGEDSESDDPRSFNGQKRWRRTIILAAGGIGNLIFAYILTLFLIIPVTRFVGTTITELADGFPGEGISGLMVGDTIISVNGEKTHYIEDFRTHMYFAQSSHVDLVLKRDGDILIRNNFNLEMREYETDGIVQLRYGLSFNVIEANFIEKLKYSVFSTINNVGLIRLSIAQLFRGNASIRDLSGPVGIVGMMNEIGQESSSFRDALYSLIDITAFIGVNIAFMNLLPIPAMDGGRILFQGINWLIEKFTKRKLNPKYEGYIHATAMVLLLGLMGFVLINDILRIIKS
ncbi:MAG: site-2 protease family protein [Oscillospiraceae bacterium]|nr:site-2 protease family protein [Oscillospiraceae bacterium]